MAISGINNPWFHLFLLMSILAVSRSADPDCVYTLYIKTGSDPRAATESKITATLFDTNGYGLEIGNVATWGGIMGQNYKYFERGNSDIFSNKAPCLTAPICALNLTSDGSGPSSGWYCDYVDLATASVGKACGKQLFKVDRWLARDATPFSLTAMLDNCNVKVLAGDKSHGSNPLLAKI